MTELDLSDAEVHSGVMGVHARASAELVREAGIEVVDPDGLFGADLERAMEYITVAYPALVDAILDE